MIFPAAIHPRLPRFPVILFRLEHIEILHKIKHKIHFFFYGEVIYYFDNLTSDCSF